MKRCLTKTSTPLFNRPDLTRIFPNNGKQLLDEKGHCRSLETILFPNTEVFLIEELGDNCVRIQTAAYPNINPLFTDRRFLKKSSQEERKSALPSKEKLISTLRSLTGLPYIWGGNFPLGVPELLDYYPPGSALSDLEKINWTFSGLDCSGLLYFITNGITPRNTSDLCHFGEEITLSMLQPLDLIVWNGHMLLMLTDQQTIEARAGRGVFISSLKEEMSFIQNHKAQFRRWYRS